jgi:hypothetical protein
MSGFTILRKWWADGPNLTTRLEILHHKLYKATENDRQQWQYTVFLRSVSCKISSSRKSKVPDTLQRNEFHTMKSNEILLILTRMWPFTTLCWTFEPGGLISLLIRNFLQLVQAYDPCASFLKLLSIMCFNCYTEMQDILLECQQKAFLGICAPVESYAA